MASAIYSTNLSKDVGASSLDALVNSVQDQYTRQYLPIQRQIARVGAGSNFGEVMQGVNDAGAQAAGNIDATEAGYRRSLQNQGGIGESTSAVRRFGLRRVLSQVDAMNRESQSARGRQEAAQAYGMDSTTRGIGLQTGILGQIAQGEANRYAQYTGAKASGQAAGNAAAGQAIGTALTIAAFM